jgi:hypothetical protein
VLAIAADEQAACGAGRASLLGREPMRAAQRVQPLCSKPRDGASALRRQAGQAAAQPRGARGRFARLGRQSAQRDAVSLAPRIHRTTGHPKQLRGETAVVASHVQHHQQQMATRLVKGNGHRQAQPAREPLGDLLAV